MNATFASKQYSWDSSSGTAFCFVQVLPVAALEEFHTRFLVHSHLDTENKPSSASCMRQPCQRAGTSLRLELSVSHLGVTAQSLLQVRNDYAMRKATDSKLLQMVRG